MNSYEKNIDKYHWYTDILGGVLVVFGIFYALFPHSAHVWVEEVLRIPFRPEHSIHIVSGVAMLLIGAGIWWYNNKLLTKK